MSIRTELPWDLIAADIDRAIRTYCKGEFLPSKNLARKIIETNPGDYPTLVEPYASLKMVTGWITMSCRKRGWKEWSGNGASKTTGLKVFVIPKEVRE
jgi:hypothetical protein